MKIYENYKSIAWGFLILFIITLSNSIFLNQIGYYGALFFLLFGWWKTKSNPFEKNGLEIFLLLYLTAELLAMIFSVDKAGAFRNLLKRAFLIPIIYTIAAAATDKKKIKTLLTIYIAFAALGATAYVGFSIPHYLAHKYQLEQSGPSIFQYPITASEMMSFACIMLFALVVNMKLKMSTRALMTAAFIVLLIAEFATFKRTGWLGMGAGLLVVLLFSKRWVMSLALIIIAAAGFLTQKNISNLLFVRQQGNALEVVHKEATAGRASFIMPLGKGWVLSDFDKGMKLLDSEGKIQQTVFTTVPVVSTLKCNDSIFAAYLLDTRIELMQFKDNHIVNLHKEFMSPGFTAGAFFFNNILYVRDADSGITVFPYLSAPQVKKRYPELSHRLFFGVDSSVFVFADEKTRISVYENKAGEIGNKIDDFTPEEKGSTVLFFKDKKLFVSNGNTIHVYFLAQKNLALIATHKTRDAVIGLAPEDSTALIYDIKGGLYQYNFKTDVLVPLNNSQTKAMIISSLDKNGNTIGICELNRGRLLSIFDPYHPSNYSRLCFWRAGFKMVKDHPVFGVGDIDLQNLYREYKRPYDKEIQGHMHNNYIHLLVTLGIVGFLVVMSLLFMIGKKMYSVYGKVKSDDLYRAYILGFAGVFTSFLVAGLTEWNFGDHEIITLIWFHLGLMFAMLHAFQRAEVKE
jgi:hypothetical protein